MFEAVIALNMLLSTVSAVQTGQALSLIERQQAFNERQDAAAVEKLRSNGVFIGKQMRVFRYCKDFADARRYRRIIVRKMRQYGQYGDIVVQTMDEVAVTQPDLSKAAPGWSCAANSRTAKSELTRLEKMP